MARTIVTTSWDDGHILDLTLAELLERHNLAGTFYIAPDNHEIAPELRLTPAQIKQLSTRFEIGSHTLTHPRLPNVSLEAATHEIIDSKAILEGYIDGPVSSFCYPGGQYLPTHLPIVQAAGYRYARTVQRFATATGHQPLEAPTTLHAYRHYSDLGQIMRVSRFHPVRTLRYLWNWDQLAIALFDHIHHTGGVFHLWGHSWEIERHGDWRRLERVLAHIAGHTDVKYLPNGQLS